MVGRFRVVSIKASRLSCRVTKEIEPTGVLNRRERMRWPLNCNKGLQPLRQRYEENALTAYCDERPGMLVKAG